MIVGQFANFSLYLQSDPLSPNEIQPNPLSSNRKLIMHSSFIINKILSIICTGYGYGVERPSMVFALTIQYIQWAPNNLSFSYQSGWIINLVSVVSVIMLTKSYDFFYQFEIRKEKSCIIAFGVTLDAKAAKNFKEKIDYEYSNI